MEIDIVLNALYIQSGGPTTVINSSAYGVIKACKKKSHLIGKIYTCKYGFWGLLQNDMFDITDISEENLEKLKRTPSMAFGSSRYRIPDGEAGIADYEKIHSVLKDNNIGIVIVNGGNGSVRASHDLSQHLKSIGYKCSIIVVPKTVDNDISYIDHAPGFPSAARNVLLTMQELSHDLKCYNTPLLCIIEVMGRDTGWLAASTVLLEEHDCAPDLIYVPEIPFSRETFVRDAKAVLEKKGKCVAVVAEGVKENGRYIFDLEKDAKNAYLNMGGTVVSLRALILDEFDCKIRAIDLGLMQRCSMNTVSELDLAEAEELGSMAVEYALEGKTDGMVSLVRVDTSEYKVERDFIPLEKVSNKEYQLPKEYVTKEHNYISTDFVKYIKPLVGDLPEYFENPILGGSNV